MIADRQGETLEELQRRLHARVRRRGGHLWSSGVYALGKSFEAFGVKAPTAGRVTEGAVNAVYICGEVDGLR